jgi:hypothetical protein
MIPGQLRRKWTGRGPVQAFALLAVAAAVIAVSARAGTH